MAEPRTVISVVSIAVALVSAGWAIYATKHSSAPSGSNGGSQQQMRAQQSIQVFTVPASERRLRIGLEAIGTAVANESVSVTSKTSNIVTAIRFSDGDMVQAGQVMVELDRGTAEADLAAITAAFEESQSQWRRSRDLLATQALSRSQYEQLEATMKANEARVDAARVRLADTYIRAPFAGNVGLRRVSVGALINPGTVVTTLDDISSIKVDFAVPEVHIGALKAGQSVAARTAAYPGRQFTGRVSSVDSRVDPGSRSVIVRAVVPNRDRALKPGMFLTVDLAQEERAALMIPEEALVPEQARQFVYVVQGDAVSKREVSLGRREPGYVEITAGIRPGDHVVVEGTLKLRDGAQVRAIERERGDAAPANVPTASGIPDARQPT